MEKLIEKIRKNYTALAASLALSLVTPTLNATDMNVYLHPATSNQASKRYVVENTGTDDIKALIFHSGIHDGVISLNMEQPQGWSSALLGERSEFYNIDGTNLQKPGEIRHYTLTSLENVLIPGEVTALTDNGIVTKTVPLPAIPEPVNNHNTFWLYGALIPLALLAYRH